jgi:hypothetical protein
VTSRPVLFLECEAQAVATQQLPSVATDYKNLVPTLKKACATTPAHAHSEFQARRLRPGESVEAIDKVV